MGHALEPSWRQATIVVVSFVMVLALLPTTRAQASPAQDVFESCLLEKINDARAENGAVPLEMASDLTQDVRAWSEWMSENEFRHMHSSERNPILPDDTTSWAENIAWHSNQNLPDCSAIHTMFMNSSGHRANRLNPNLRFAGLGAYVDHSGWWVTELFFDVRDCNGTFCDDDTSVFEDAIEKIVAEGITRGCNPPTNNRFCPDDYVSRGEMAAFLARALGLPEGQSVDFIDDDTSVFEDAIEKIAAAGITRGCNPPTNNRFCPDDYVSRGEMAAFLARALGL